MSKQALKYVCQNCGSVSPKWLGKCPDCNSWNSFAEEFLPLPRKGVSILKQNDNVQTCSLDKITQPDNLFLPTKINEFDRVLGGGIVAGSSILIGGEPGIGKSTLALQLAGILSKENAKILYITGEESPHQLKLRAERLGIYSANIYIAPQTNLLLIENEIRNINPNLIIIDSIQTISHPELPSVMGSVSQIRQCAAELITLTKSLNIPLILIGHVTKEGTIAGPRLLEHMVDTVLYFEGDRKQQIRILRSFKNRFGSTNDIGIWEMSSIGLKEISSPSSIFIDKNSLTLPGSSLSITLEGMRPFIVEVQALACPSKSSFPPRRNFTGVDYNRTAMIIAILEKKVGLYLSQEDIFINIVGGIRINEPTIDLALAMALCSSFKNKTLPENSLFIGEIGLSGELRAIGQIEKRINEASKLGIKQIYLPKTNMSQISTTSQVKLNPVSSLKDLTSTIF